MPLDLILPLVTAAITAFIAVFTTFLSARVNRQRELDRQKIDEVLAASSAKAEEARVAVAQTLAEKLPAGISVEQVPDRLSTPYRNGGDVIMNQIVKQGGDLIGDLVDGYHHQALSQARVQ